MAGGEEDTVQPNMIYKMATEAATTHPATREEAGSTVAAISTIGPGPTDNQNSLEVVILVV
jgi:hypothetical protein